MRKPDRSSQVRTLAHALVPQYGTAAVCRKPGRRETPGAVDSRGKERREPGPMCTLSHSPQTGSTAPLPRVRGVRRCPVRRRLRPAAGAAVRPRPPQRGLLQHVAASRPGAVVEVVGEPHRLRCHTLSTGPRSRNSHRQVACRKAIPLTSLSVSIMAARIGGEPKLRSAGTKRFLGGLWERGGSSARSGAGRVAAHGSERDWCVTVRSRSAETGHRFQPFGR
jgi:hypothetical protein